MYFSLLMYEDNVVQEIISSEDSIPNNDFEDLENIDIKLIIFESYFTRTMTNFSISLEEFTISSDQSGLGMTLFFGMSNSMIPGLNAIGWDSCKLKIYGEEVPGEEEE